MLYIVSGFMRCGTSMMMEALEAGGMKAAYSTRRNAEMNARWGGPNYKPNDNYYELDAVDYHQNLAEVYDGRLVKCLAGGLLRLPSTGDGYRIIFMRRPQAEIRASLVAFFGTDEQANSPNFERNLDLIVDIMRDRRSVVGIDVVEYRTLLDPERAFDVFNGLRESGWPINPELATRVPRVEKVRFSLPKEEKELPTVTCSPWARNLYRN